jgi:SulP family sulfate permease
MERVQSLLSSSVSVAFVAILETMISGKIADRLSTPASEMNDRREVFGLGVANVMSGLCGGLPASAFVGRMQIFIRSGVSGPPTHTLPTACPLLVH